MWNRSKQFLLLDIDGPIADWKLGFIQRLNKMKGTNYSMKDTGHAWDIKDDLKLDAQTSKEVYHQMDGFGVSRTLPEVEGSVSAVMALAQLYNLYFLTSENRSSVDWVYGRRNWLISKFGLDIADNVVSTHHKYLVYGDVFVDDKLDHLVAWRQFWISRGFTHHCAIRYTCGRRPTDTPNGILEASSWKELFPMLTSGRQLKENGND